MKKSELIAKAAEKCYLSQKQTKRCLDALLGIIADELGNNAEVVIPFFGKFHVRETKAVTKKAPNGKVVDVPAKKRVRFKPSPNIHTYSTRF